MADYFKAITMFWTERDINIGRSGVITTRRSRDRRFLRFIWNSDQLGFDVVQVFPEDGD